MDPKLTSELLRDLRSAATEGELEKMFDYDPTRKKYKLRKQYTLSESAIEQRRQAAKRPRRGKINNSELIDFCDLLVETLNVFRDRLQKNESKRHLAHSGV